MSWSPRPPGAHPLWLYLSPSVRCVHSWVLGVWLSQALAGLITHLPAVFNPPWLSSAYQIVNLHSMVVLLRPSQLLLAFDVFSLRASELKPTFCVLFCSKESPCFASRSANLLMKTHLYDKSQLWELNQVTS